LLRETVGHLRDLPRYRQILATLIRYGYRDVVSALHLEGLAKPFESMTLGDNVPPADRAQRLRMVCEELGPTFVKLGQLLSTRPDLLPDAYIRELALLRDDVRPYPFEEATAILEADFEGPVEARFGQIDPEPLASASISQVHSTVLPNGQAAVLKIRRPHIEQVVEADLDILKNLATLAERQLPWMARYKPTALAREFERNLRRELDLNAERLTMQRCRLQMENVDYVHVPKSFDNLCSKRVLTMERVDGVGVDDLEGIRAMGVDPAEVAKRGARILLAQIFRYGFFHADPHPGNLQILPKGVVAPLDYGLFGQIDLPTRERIAALLIGLLAQDTDRVLKALHDLEIRGEQTDQRALRRDIGEMVLAYSDLKLDTIDLSKLLGELVQLVRHHRLVIPLDLILLIRSLVTIESVGRRLDPHFDIAAEARPFVQELTRKRYSPSRFLTIAAHTVEDLQQLVTLLPEVLNEALESIRQGELTVKFDLHGFEKLVKQITRAANSLAAGVVITGLLVGSSLVVQAESRWHHLGIAGYLVASILGVWLLWNMFRGG